jgi:RNA polymerase-binding transcription factor DksA
MTTTTPANASARRQSGTAVPSSTRRAPAHLRRALLAEAKRRSDQLGELAPALDDDLGQALLMAAQRTMAEVGEALRRWAQGSYGLCLGCGQEIPVARLELRAWASHCVDCARR